MSDSEPKPFDKSASRVIDWENVLATKKANGWSYGRTVKEFGVSKDALAWRVRRARQQEVKATSLDVSIDWEAIRVARIKEGLTYAELQERFGVNGDAIALRAVEESWPTPAAFEQHSIIKRSTSLAEKSVDLMNAWRRVNIGKLLDNMEAYMKLPPMDPETVDDEALARRTKILRVIQMEESLLSQHVGRGAKLAEMELNQNGPTTNSLTISLSDLGRQVREGVKTGILASDDVVIDVTTEAREREQEVYKALEKE